MLECLRMSRPDLDESKKVEQKNFWCDNGEKVTDCWERPEVQDYIKASRYLMKKTTN